MSFHQEFLIDQVLPAREVGLLAGAPAAGKTTLGIPLLDEMEQSKPWFGYNTYGTKSVFVSCDRSESAHLRRLDDFKLPYDRFPFVTGRSSDLNLHDLIRGCAFRFPDRPFLFIDGFQSLLNGNASDYQQVARFMREAGRLCEEFNRTILGSVHAVKVKENQTYKNPRELVLGSQAWGGFSDLVIVLQPFDDSAPDDRRRVMWVCTRTSVGERKYILIPDAATGRYVEWEDPDENSLLAMLSEWIVKQPFERVIPTREIVEYGITNCALTKRTIERFLTKLVDDGVLCRPRRGFYQRRMNA